MTVSASHLPYGRQERARCLICKMRQLVAQGNGGDCTENAAAKHSLSCFGLLPQGSAVGAATVQGT